MSDPIVKFEVPTTETRPIEAPDLTAPDGPLPSDPRLIVQTILLVIAVLAVCYFASPIILPIVLAFVLKLLLMPGMRAFDRLRAAAQHRRAAADHRRLRHHRGPRRGDVGPAAAWVARLPEGMVRLEERLAFLARPLQALQTFLHQFDGGTASGARRPLPDAKR